MAGSIFQRATETSVTEGNRTIQVEFVRSGSTQGAVTIQYGVDADTATPGLDYSATGGTVVMPDGASSVFVPIAILDDALGEATEVFTVSLISTTGADLLAPRTNRISILDDETPAPPPPVEPPLVSDYAIGLDTLIAGLSQPIRFAFSPADDNVMYIAEKDGLIRVADLAAGSVATLLDLRAQTNNAGDRGLLDVAVNPDFENNPYIYAYYVVDPPDTATNAGAAGRDGIGNRYAQIVRYTADAATGYRTLVPNSAVVLVGAAGQSLSDISGGGALDYTDPANAAYIASDRQTDQQDRVIGGFKQDYLKVDNRSHAGGRLLFGPDGMLYAFTGDGTSYNYADPRTPDVQRLDSLSGKVLRIDPITGSGLADNPFAAGAEDLTANRARIWQYGLRNPFSGAFDDTGRLFIADVGWFSFEEINTAGPGANFGWPFYEGGDGGTLVQTPQYRDHPLAAAFYASVVDGSTVITTPFRAFNHSSAAPGYQMQAIISSGMIGDAGPYPAALAGRFIFADFVGGNVFSVDPDNRLDTNFLLDWPGDYGPIYMLQHDDGYLYYADITAGTIGRLEIADAPAGGGAVLAISTVTDNANEGNDATTPFVFRIARTGATGTAVTVDWRATGAIGVATAPAEPADFPGLAFPAGTLSFAAGQAEALLTVAVAGDLLGEYNERFAVELTNPSAGATISQVDASAIIVNDDGGLAILSIAGLTRAEGNGGVAYFPIPVTRTGSLFDAVTAEWAVEPGFGPGTTPADRDDFLGGTFPSGIVSFAPDQKTAIISVPVAADALGEFNERFAITLSNASEFATISVGAATAVILNDDSQLTLAPSQAEVAEGNAVVLTVTRIGTTGTASAGWAVGVGLGGGLLDPAAADDFPGGVFPSGTVSFAAGQSSQTITIHTAADTRPEGLEGFHVGLGGPSAGTTFLADFAEVTILDDDSRIAIAPAFLTAAEGTGAMVFEISRFGGTGVAASVDWSLAGIAGTGTLPASADDFAGGTFPAGTIHIPAGQSGVSLTIALAADSRIELNERFAVTLSNPSAGATLAAATAQGVILDDDSLIAIGTRPVQHAEGTGGTTPFVFAVTRTGNTAAAATAEWTVAGAAGPGTLPAAASDFAGGTFPAGTIAFAPGATAATLTVAVAADSAAELNERFAVTLAAPTGGATLAPGAATGIIRNDDATVAIDPTPRFVAEGDAGTTLVTLAVTRTGLADAAASVAWTLAPGGIAGTLPVTAADFAPATLPGGGTIAFAPGQTSRLLTFAIAGDTAPELNESFTVTLSAPSPGLALGNATAAVAIIDDDTIRGTDGDDALLGTPLGDLFVLGHGHDTITAGAGGDTFRFLPGAIGPASQNSFTFNDFSPASWERLDLARIDANPATAPDEAFAFIGSAAFSGTPGELRWQQEDGFRLIQGNIDSNPAPDLTLIVAGTGPVTGSWFIL